MRSAHLALIDARKDPVDSMPEIVLCYRSMQTKKGRLEDGCGKHLSTSLLRRVIGYGYLHMKNRIMRDTHGLHPMFFCSNITKSYKEPQRESYAKTLGIGIVLPACLRPLLLH